jgi:hypothetical protein
LGVPAGSTTVCPSAAHVEAETHFVCTHVEPGAQSLAVAHAVVHAFVAASHAYGAHALVIGAGQLPMPSQLAGSVWTPFVQLGARQPTDGPT